MEIVACGLIFVLAFGALGIGGLVWRLCVAEAALQAVAEALAEPRRERGGGCGAALTLVAILVFGLCVLVSALAPLANALPLAGGP